MNSDPWSNLAKKTAIVRTSYFVTEEKSVYKRKKKLMSK